jgi:hypothetical protein
MPITSRVCLCCYKNEPLMVNFKFAKFHCYQQNTVEEELKSRNCDLQQKLLHRLG